jgi:hypothetical protein
MEAMKHQTIDALLISTHNGMALDYASQLKVAMNDEDLQMPVVIGGVLNQKVDYHELPVPVEKELIALGFHPALSLPNLPNLLTKVDEIEFKQSLLDQPDDHLT